MAKLLKTLRLVWPKAKGFGAGLAATGALSVALAGGPGDTFTKAACRIATELTAPTIVFGAMLLIVLWAGYSIYMGKRDATEIVVRGMIASAIVLGAKGIATWFAAGQCQQ